MFHLASKGLMMMTIMNFFEGMLAGFSEENYLGLVFKGLLSNSCMLRSLAGLY